AGGRRRLPPVLIRDGYRNARAAIDRKGFAEAEPQLIETRMLLQEAATLGVKDDRIADLSELVEGFIGLIQSSAQSRAASQAAAASPPGAPAGGVPAEPAVRQPVASTPVSRQAIAPAPANVPARAAAAPTP